ncbi:MAG TPA: GNAT family N-acetyltransferase [Anaeromyxobacteraceae bacterium]|nr:GNAT family N-acetyltransferase [Anaeromyxobacteraceae bacterium]
MATGAQRAAERARRVERAHALQLERTRVARGAGGPSVEVAGGLAVCHGTRSPFSAAVGVGLGAAVDAADVDRIEAHLGVGGGPVRVEVTPWTDASLTEELGRRGYQLERLFLVWVRGPSADLAPASARPAGPGDEAAWADVFAQVFLGAPARSESQRDAIACVARAEGNVPWILHVDGRAAGVALSSSEGGVALLSGAGVLPAFRGRALQADLVRARLAWAGAAGCDLVASVTEPATASHRTLEACGFRTAYPKAVLVR